jgi:hypothetical protein
VTNHPEASTAGLLALPGDRPHPWVSIELTAQGLSRLCGGGPCLVCGACFLLPRSPSGVRFRGEEPELLVLLRHRTGGEFLAGRDRGELPSGSSNSMGGTVGLLSLGWRGRACYLGDLTEGGGGTSIRQSTF